MPWTPQSGAFLYADRRAPENPRQPAPWQPFCLERFERGEELPRSTQPTAMIELPLSATEVHLVDSLLDAAASGVNNVEREGISYSHPARFILIGTMNPEEGELRPQLLDRFGLGVTVRGLQDPEDRKEIARRRIAFERDAEAFLSGWADEESALRRQIMSAREGLDAVIVPEKAWDLSVSITSQACVHGHRADITLVKTATALASLLGKPAVSSREVVEAARFVLPHRIHDAPLLTPESGMEKIEAFISSAVEGKAPGAARASNTSNKNKDSEPADTDEMQVPGAAAAGSIHLSLFKKNSSTELRTGRPNSRF